MLQMINFDNIANQSASNLGVNNAKTSTDFYNPSERAKKDKDVQLPKVHEKKANNHSQDVSNTDHHHYDEKEPKM
jgi:protein required for attachment to host cells